MSTVAEFDPPPAGTTSSQAAASPAAARSSSVKDDDRQHSRRWAILAILALAQLTVVLDSTVVNIALPSAQKALDFSNNDRQWIVTAYSLAFGSLLLLGGRLADLFGRKNVLITGLIGFSVASAVGGAATSFEMLVAARAVQGAFGALLAPAALALLTTTFTDRKERAQAFGIYGAIAGGGAAVGLLLGGVLTEYLSWRWTLYVNIVLAIPAVIGGLLLLVHRPAEQRPRLDLPGTISVSAGLFALVYGFSHAETGGWGSALTLGSLIAAAVLIAVFVVIQRRSANPLLPLRVILDRNRGGAFIAMLLSAAGLFGVFLFLTYYLQQSLGYSAVSTGVAFLPMVGLLIVVSAVASTLLSSRVGPRVTMPIGLLLGALGLVYLTRIGPNSTYAADLLPALLLLGAGLGLTFASAINVATLGVNPEDAGVASATVNTMQQVGGAVGTALLNTLAATAVTSYLRGKTISPKVSELAAIHSYTVAFWVSAGIFASGAVLSALILRSGIPATDPDAEPVAVG
jgi:EmrB/QacA subfamily drug resistance transporter